MFTDILELGRLIADRLILLDQVMTMRAERDRLVAALEQIGTVWRNADGTWSHPRDAAETDLRFHQEWARK